MRHPDARERQEMWRVNPHGSEKVRNAERYRSRQRLRMTTETATGAGDVSVERD